LLTPPAEAAASQKWKIIYLQVLSICLLPSPPSDHKYNQQNIIHFTTFTVKSQRKNWLSVLGKQSDSQKSPCGEEEEDKATPALKAEGIRGRVGGF